MDNIARMFKGSTIAVLKWIKVAAHSTLPESKPEAEIVMIDDFWHLANGKKDVWLWRAIDRVSRQPLGWELGNRSDACLQKLVQIL